ncbi:hypothetical protein UFOVP164_28 [uncultured Caudovirales phage]|uniref:Uncharacterized protein n=1 Tax=uncultured Caudovirales phage TaxID=2100421 RepID=A0A6J7XM32_9CAUD|nr:hypothetical protein UFOVP164_28 [uncultured Caudovirales phage]
MLPKKYRKHTGELPDRKILEMGMARMLFRTYQSNKDKIWVNQAIESTERLYGTGAPLRIRQYMRDMREGRLE